MSARGKRRGLRALRAVVAAVALAALTTATAAAAPATAAASIGVQDFSYAPLGGSPTESKPESKLWFNDGRWWASMFDPATQDHHIFWLDRSASPERWVDTGTTLDTRNSTRADTLWDGTHLYVASHVFTSTAAATTSATTGKLWSFTYSPVTRTYTKEFGPIDINAARTETLVIDEDSGGRLWATWMQGNQVWVTHATGADNRTWVKPFVIPGPTGTPTPTGDDISSLIAFKSKIGVMWSNQGDHRFWFAIHDDSAADGTWTAAPVPTTPSTVTSDDHVNLKADLAGNVYAAVKTSQSASTQPLILLLVRSFATGTWSNFTYGTVRDSHTRPIVEIEGDVGATRDTTLHMFATCPQPPNTSGQSGGDICEKTTPLGNIGFVPGPGTAVIRDSASAEMNDATSTKQRVTAATGLVVMANNPTTDVYWHADLSLGAAQPPTLSANFTAAQAASPPLTMAFTDTSTGSPTSWSWSFGDAATSTAQNPSHTYAQAGTYTVTLTVRDAAGETSTTSRTVTVAAAPQPGGGTTQTFAAAADSQVKSSSPNTNYGTLDSVRVRAGVATDATNPIYRTYVKFNVSGITGRNVTSVKLRLFCTDAGPDGGSVFAVDSGWVENALTWANAPALPGTPSAPAVAAALNAPVEISLPASAVSTNGAPADGTYSFALAGASTNSVIYGSRESANPPQLVVTTG